MCAMYVLSCPTDFIGRGFVIIQQWLFTKIAGSFHNMIFQSLTAILLRITKKPAFAGIFYSYRKLSIGFSLAAFIAGITPDASPTTTATVTDTTTGHALNGTS